MWEHFSEVQQQARLKRLQDLSQVDPRDLNAMYVLGVWEWRKGSRTAAESLLLNVGELSRVSGENIVKPFSLPDFVQATTKDDPLYADLGYQADPELLADYAGDEGEWENHYVVAANPLTPEAALRTLIANAVEDEAIAVGSNFGLPDSFYVWYAQQAHQLSMTLGISALITLAGNPAIPLEVMKKVQGVEEPAVRETLAGNYSVPLSILRLLAQDSELSVRETVTRNPFYKEDLPV